MYVLDKNEPKDPHKFLDISLENLSTELFSRVFGKETSQYIHALFDLAKRDSEILQIDFGGLWTPSYKNTGDFYSDGLLFRIYRQNMTTDTGTFLQYLNENGIKFNDVIPEKIYAGRVEKDPDCFLVLDKNAKVYSSFLSAMIKD